MSRLRNPRLWVALLSAAAVCYLALGDIGKKSPGPVSAVHAAVPDLADGTNCSACHGGWFSDMPQACLSCHEVIGEQIEDGNGLHGVLGADRARVCALCHSEHHGGGFKVVNRQSFAQAGASIEDFDHQLIGYTMEGRHLELGCTECHQNADVAVLPAGERRFLGLDQNCATCHEDAHQGRMVLACVKCHGQQAFDQLEPAGHEAHLPLSGGHGDVACRSCHVDDSAHALQSLGEGAPTKRRACADCHESPHREGFVSGVAKLVAKHVASSCVVCHLTAHLSFREEGLVITPAQHACSGFRLEAPHDEVVCQDCHLGESESFGIRYPGRGQDDCHHCHGDPHGGQFEGGPFADSGCVGCHDRHRFKPHGFTAERHRETAFTLTGQHLETDCHGCHRQDEPGRGRVFRGTPPVCARCHADAHAGYFDARQEGLPDVEHGACARCHFTTAFGDVPHEEFDHPGWTGFDVVGAHAQLDCEGCHPRAKEPDDAGRRFGRVVEHFGEYHGCVTCHTDIHGGQFDQEGLPEEVDGKAGCARCHVETSFRTFPDGFDHGKWTGFTLEGAHQTTGCVSCHAPLRRPDELGRMWQRAPGKDCESCHDDPHAGQFRVRGSTDCARCHRSAAGFFDLSFRHDIHSRFRLGAQHERLACSACHKPVRIGDAQVVRYRPLNTNCVDCHGSNHKPFRSRRGGRR